MIKIICAINEGKGMDLKTLSEISFGLIKCLFYEELTSSKISFTKSIEYHHLII
jgi:hypothetical protein